MIEKVKYIWPPHPDSRMKIRPESLDKLEKQGGWLAQRKFNGSHCVVHLHHGKIQLWNRHAEPFSTYRLKDSMEQCFARGILDKDAELVLNGELLHTKAKSKITARQAQDNTIVLFDLLYFNGMLLTQNFEQRYNMLKELCALPEEYEGEKKRGLSVETVGESQLWLAETFPDDFTYHFYEMYEFDDAGNDKFPEIEGLVCKRAKYSNLKLGTQKYDVNWMMRVRKTKEKIYLF